MFSITLVCLRWHICWIVITTTTITSTAIRETFDLKRFGCFKQSCQLILRNVHFTTVHIIHHGTQFLKLYILQDENWMFIILLRQQSLFFCWKEIKEIKNLNLWKKINNLQQSRGYMPIRRLYVLSKIFLQLLMCNRREFHSPIKYQRLISMCSDDCSIGDKIVDHHPCLMDGIIFWILNAFRIQI